MMKMGRNYHRFSFECILAKLKSSLDLMGYLVMKFTLIEHFQTQVSQIYSLGWKCTGDC